MPRLPDRSLTTFLRTSFQILRREHAGAFAAMIKALGYGRLYLQVDEESVVLRFGRATPQVWAAQPRDRQPPAVLTSRRAILRMADGELTILEAVQGGDPVVVASPDDLMRLERGLNLYLRGAVRCPSFPALLEQFRETVERPSG